MELVSYPRSLWREEKKTSFAAFKICSDFLLLFCRWTKPTLNKQREVWKKSLKLAQICPQFYTLFYFVCKWLEGKITKFVFNSFHLIFYSIELLSKSPIENNLKSLLDALRDILTNCFFFDWSGVINAEGKLWKDQRRFLHEKLRGFGITHVNSKNTKLHDLIKVRIDLQNLWTILKTNSEIIFFPNRAKSTIF